MKINCNHYKGKNTTHQCTLCKEYYRCNLIEPTNKKHTLLIQEIEYWLNELHQAKQRIKKYHTILNDINNHKYTFPVNVYGHIQYAPKQNIFGVTIRKPEHIIYGWNLNKLEKSVNDLIEKIRSLRLQEFELRKELGS